MLYIAILATKTAIYSNLGYKICYTQLLSQFMVKWLSSMYHEHHKTFFGLSLHEFESGHHLEAASISHLDFFDMCKVNIASIINITNIAVLPIKSAIFNFFQNSRWNDFLQCITRLKQLLSGVRSTPRLRVFSDPMGLSRFFLGTSRFCQWTHLGLSGFWDPSWSIGILRPIWVHRDLQI